MTNLVGIGKGLVHDDDEGMAEEGSFIVTTASQGITHNTTSEILIAIEQGIDDEMTVVEVPGQEFAVFFVGQLEILSLGRRQEMSPRI